MVNRERIIRAIQGLPCTDPAIQIDYTPKMERKMCDALRIDPEELFAMSGNCIRYASSLGNVEEYFNFSIPFDEKHQTAMDHKIAVFDPEKRVVYDVFGVGWSYDSEGVNSEIHPLEDMTAYSSYHWPLPNREVLMNPARETVKAYGGKDYILGFQHIGLYERSWALRGYENFLCDLLTEPDFVEEMLDHILEYKLEEAQLYLDAGVDAVRIGDDWGLQNNLQMSPEVWRKFFKPRYEKLYHFYRDRGYTVFQHSCGDIFGIVPDLMEIGLDVLHPIQPLSMDISELIRLCGDRLTFWGGIDTQRLMPYGSPEQIRQQSGKTFEILSAHQKYIAGPSQELMSDVPVENAMALIGALKQKREAA